MELDNEEKNYYRILLKDVSDTGLSKPITLAGKYQHDERFEYATFTNVRILLSPPYSKTRIICDHLNILKRDIVQFYDLEIEDNKKKFFFVGYPTEYQMGAGGGIRYGFRLSEEVSFAPFGILRERELYQNKIDTECADLSEWVQNNITEKNIGVLKKIK